MDIAELLIRYSHFLGIILLAAGLMVEQFLIGQEVSAEVIRKLANADALCGFSVLLILISGPLLWFEFGKPASFYSGSWVFHLKLTLVLVIILMAVIPAIFFARNRNTGQTSIQIPMLVIRLVRLEMLLLLFVPLLAVFMARGYGLN